MSACLICGLPLVEGFASAGTCHRCLGKTHEYKRTVVYFLEQRRDEQDWLIQWTYESFADAIVSLRKARAFHGSPGDRLEFRLVEFETIRREIMERV